MSRAAQKLISASGGADAYEIEQSLRFNHANDPYLIKTPGSNGNRDIWTLSFWTKMDAFDSYYMFGSKETSGSGDLFYVYNGSSGGKNQLQIYHSVSGSAYRYIPNMYFEDFGGWYHIVLAWDSTQGTAANRVKLWVNGDAISSWNTYNDWTQNQDTLLNYTGANNTIGAVYGHDGATNISGEYKGYIAQVHFLDGVTADHEDFGKTNSATNQWVPKEYTGSFGTNGYYLPFTKNERYSVYCDGSNTAGIEVADSSDFDMGSGDMTCEMWFYVDDDAGNYRRLCGQSAAAAAQAQIPFAIEIDTNNKPVGYLFYSGANYETLLSSATINDNEWNHVALVRNSGTATLYLNGTSVVSQSTSVTLNTSAGPFGIGCLGAYAGENFKGWISNFRLVVGSAVYTSNFTPSTSPLTAVTNTKILCCQDATVTTDNSGESQTLSVTAANTYTQQMAPFNYDWYQDQSGEDNDFQPDNITVHDVLLDSPTNNFCVWNSADTGSYCDLTQGNLTSAGNTAADAGWTHSTMAMMDGSGKWYSEHRVEALFSTGGNYPSVGVSSIKDGYYNGTLTTSRYYTDYCYIRATGNVTEEGSIFTEQSGMDLGSNLSAGDIINVAVDTDNKRIWFGVNGTWNGSGNPGGNSNPTFTYSTATDLVISAQHLKGTGAGEGTSTVTSNFGQNGTFNGEIAAGGNSDGSGIGNFKYSVPSNFKAVCTKSISAPSIKKPESYFNTVLYTGNNTEDRAITGVGFAPDFVWLKSRSNTYSHQLHDAARGTSGGVLYSNATNAQDATYSLASFDSDGFTVMKDADNDAQNDASENYVVWCWKANGSGSSNEDGSINTTKTSASTASGFSIATYTGSGSNATIGHGLGAAPGLIIVKNLDQTDKWVIYSSVTDETDYLQFDRDTSTVDDNTMWNDTAPTSSVFSIGTAHEVNASTEKYVAYCFANVEGYLKIGKYLGNGSANPGTFVHTGFRPSFVVWKRTNDVGRWQVIDNKRDTFNISTHGISWNSNAVENTGGGYWDVDFLCNGFKFRTTETETNNSGSSYLYMAFAEAPFKYANAR